MLQDKLKFLEKESVLVRRVLDGVPGDEEIKRDAHDEIKGYVEIISFYLADIYEKGFSVDGELRRQVPKYWTSLKYRAMCDKLDSHILKMRSVPGDFKMKTFLPKYAFISIN
jgi:hypothetical protein